MSTRIALRRRLLISITALFALAGCGSPAPRDETVMMAEPVIEDGAEPNQEPAHQPLRGASLNNVARMLGGMTGGEWLGPHAAWPYHQQKMDALWGSFLRGRGGKVRGWAAAEISDLQRHRAVFYPFSGPDFLFAHELFPNAGTYILCGLEGAEMLPDVASMSAGEMASGLDGLRHSLADLMDAGYFVSKDMRDSLQASRFRGVLPIFLALLARTGNSVTSVEPVGGEGNGLLVRFKSPGGGSRRLYYFKQDLSNSGIKPDGPFLNFVSSHGNPPALIKSASYLMHQSSFSTIRNYLLQSSAGIVQDPSGVPYRDLVAAGFSLSLYGNYQGTLNIFSQQQPDLTEAYQTRRHPVKSVIFGFGYLYNPYKTSIIVARRR